MIGVPNHPNWTIFSRSPLNANDSLRVITYINIRLSYFQFYLWKDIFNHKGVSCISFFNCKSVYFLINIYSDLSQTALKYLKNTEANSLLVIVTKEHIQTRKCIIVKNSKEEDKFIAELIGAIKRLNTENIPSKEVLEKIIQTFANDTDRI